MIQVFLKWLEFCKIPKPSIWLELFIHESHQNRVKDIILYWSKQTGFAKSHFTKIYYKRGNTVTKRKNSGNLYYGVLRVRVRKSSTFLRTISGWTNGLYKDINKFQ